MASQTRVEDSGALNVKNLSSELSLVSWHQLGIQLGLQPAQLSQIEIQHPVDIERRMVEVFVLWLKGNPGASWSHIVAALGEMGDLTTAEKIELKYVKGARDSAVGPGTSSRDIIPALREMGDLTAGAVEKIEQRSVKRGRADSHPEESSSKADDFAYENRQAINGKFADLLTNVHRRMSRMKININEFLIFVIALFPPGHCIPRSPTNLSKVFEAITLNGLWDYFHYSPLVRIVEKFGAGDPDMQAWIKKYQKDLKAYAIVQTVKDCIESDLDTCADQPRPKRAKHDRHYNCPVEWKTEFVDHSLQYLAEVWKMFSGHYLIPDSPPTALLDRVRKGCVSVTWLVPSYLIPQLVERVKMDTKFFQKFRILKVTVRGETVYEETTDEREMMLVHSQWLLHLILGLTLSSLWIVFSQLWLFLLLLELLLLLIVWLRWLWARQKEQEQLAMQLLRQQRLQLEEEQEEEQKLEQKQRQLEEKLEQKQRQLEEKEEQKQQQEEQQQEEEKLEKLEEEEEYLYCGLMPTQRYCGLMHSQAYCEPVRFLRDKRSPTEETEDYRGRSELVIGPRYRHVRRVSQRSQRDRDVADELMHSQDSLQMHMLFNTPYDRDDLVISLTHSSDSDHKTMSTSTSSSESEPTVVDSPTPTTKSSSSEGHRTL